MASFCGGDAVEHLLQGHAFQEGSDLVAQRVPQAVRQAALARHAGLVVLAAAARHAHVLLDRRHDLGDGDGGGRPAQAVAARAPARALDQAGPAQLQEQLLQVGKRDLLALGDGRQRQRALGAVLGEIGHGHDRVPASGVQLHVPGSIDGAAGPAPRRSCTRHPCPCYVTRHRRRPPRTVRNGTSATLFRTVLNLQDIWKFRARKSSIFAACKCPICGPVGGIRPSSARPARAFPPTQQLRAHTTHARADHQRARRAPRGPLPSRSAAPTARSPSSCIRTRSSAAR